MKVEVQEMSLYIEAEAKEQMDLWVHMAKGEISGMGLVEEVKDKFLISRVFLPHQKCNGAETSIEPEAVAKLMIEIEAAGFDSSKMKFWWHSHGDMGVFWSDTDKTTIDKFRPQDFFISIVVNKKGELKTRVDYYHPFRITFHDVPTDVNLPDFGQQEACKKLFDERVIESRCFHSFGFSDFGHEALDLSRQEIINKICTGEMDWQEAQRLLAEESDAWEGWEL